MKRYIRQVPIKSNNLEFDKLKEEMLADSLKRQSEKRVRFYTSKKKRAFNRKRLRRLKEQRLEEHSKRLEDNLPRSEIWFRNKYLKEAIVRHNQTSLFQDQFNKPFNNTYIPDISNRGYRYIVEIDGSWHDRADQQLKDIKKDYYFKKRGYIIIRVKDGDESSYNTAIEQIKARIREIDESSK